MNSFIKNNLLLAILCTSATIAPANTPTTADTLWKSLNIVGGAGSAASLVFWATKALEAQIVVLPAPYGAALDPRRRAIAASDLISRLALDAACLGASIYNNDDNTEFSVGLNTTCLLGSVYSLLLWMPAIKANRTNPLFVARGLIDTIQIILNAKRVYNWWYNDTVTNPSQQDE